MINSGFCTPFITVAILAIISFCLLMYLEITEGYKGILTITYALHLPPYLYVIYQLCKQNLKSLAWWVIATHIISVICTSVIFISMLLPRFRLRAEKLLRHND